ncbi:MAG: TonB-dependent receptor [Chitinophagaceae bacterium]|nr:TonB-dependent receptor [Chitinophagaceae bacterium]
MAAYTAAQHQCKLHLAAQANIGWQISSKLQASIHGRYVGKRFDVGGFRLPDVALADYFLLGLHVGYQATQQLSFFADAQNLADTHYVEIRGYNSMPRNVQVGARFKF